MRQQRRLIATEATGPTDFSAGFTGTARLSAANTGGRFNPANSVPLTVACFVYPTTLTPGTYYPYARVEGGSAGADGWHLQRDGTLNQFQMGYSNGTNYFNVDGVSPSVNTWYLLIGGWSNNGGASSQMELRVYGPSGALADNTNVGTGFINASATGALMLGGSSDGVTPGEARIDKLGIWNRSLTGAEADTLWNGGAGLTGGQLALTSLATGLLRWWDLDEASGTASWPAYAGGVALSQTGTVTRQPRAGQ